MNVNPTCPRSKKEYSDAVARLRPRQSVARVVPGFPRPPSRIPSEPKTRSLHCTGHARCARSSGRSHRTAGEFGGRKSMVGKSNADGVRRVLGLQGKLTVMFVVVTLMVAGLASAALYRVARDQIVHDLRLRLGDTVAVAAAMLDGDLQDRITVGSGMDSTAYRTMKATLQGIRDSATDLHFVYTMRRDAEGAIRFVVDAEENPADMAALGDVYDDASKTLHDHFTTMDGPVVESRGLHRPMGDMAFGLRADPQSRRHAGRGARHRHLGKHHSGLRKPFPSDRRYHSGSLRPVHSDRRRPVRPCDRQDRSSPWSAARSESPKATCRYA